MSSAKALQKQIERKLTKPKKFCTNYGSVFASAIKSFGSSKCAEFIGSYIKVVDVEKHKIATFLLEVPIHRFGFYSELIKDFQPETEEDQAIIKTIFVEYEELHQSLLKRLKKKKFHIMLRQTRRILGRSIVRTFRVLSLAHRIFYR